MLTCIQVIVLEGVEQVFYMPVVALPFKFRQHEIGLVGVLQDISSSLLKLAYKLNFRWQGISTVFALVLDTCQYTFYHSISPLGSCLGVWVIFWPSFQ